MKKILFSSLLTILSFLPFTELSAQYISFTTTQASNSPVYPGQRKEMILRLEVEIGSTPVIISNLIFNTVGSSNPVTDIINARLWFYNDSTALDTTLGFLIGTYNNPWMSNGVLMSAGIPYIGLNSFSGLIPSQKNYLWLTYDLMSSAVLCNIIDSEIVEMLVDGVPKVPTTTTPTGYRVISPCATGLNEPLLENAVSVFPNPSYDDINVAYIANEFENLTIELYNLTSAKAATLFDGTINKSITEFKFSLSTFPSGVYYLNCVSDKGVFVKKIMKL